MHLSSSLAVLALSASALAHPHDIEARTDAAAAQPTVYLIGDSTMAPGGGGNGTEGWGQYLHYSLSIPVINMAVAGRSARSYTEEGRFANVSNLIKKGDFVIIEFGHNDGTSNPDNGRSDCVGTGNQTCIVYYNGMNDTTYTFNKYMDDATYNYTSKGAHVIISSQTPNNPWETGNFTYAPPRFVPYSQLVANTTHVPWADHNNYTYALYRNMTPAAVDALFPMDHTHTAPAGAALVAQTFVRSLVCERGHPRYSRTSHLNRYVVNATKEIEGMCIKHDMG